MSEIGIDMAGQASKSLDQFLGQPWDWVVTLCDNAREACPLFPGIAKLVHKDFDDPPYLAATAANEEEALVHCRRVRDQIRAMVEELPSSLDS